MPEWQRKRNPDDVPTPLAVAVSDYCRRARAPSGASEVREALALLAEDEDFRVRALTDAEPEASPLGPFALVDVIRGAVPFLAAARQSCGYYELARALAVERARVAPLPAPPSATPPSVPARAPAPLSRKAKAEAALTSLNDRVAPRKRLAAPGVEEEVDDPIDGYAKRELPRPKGRFTRLAASKVPADELFKPEGAAYLDSLLEQHGQRVGMLRALTEQYAGRAGSLFGEADLEEALAHHGLIAKVEAQERGSLLSSFTEHRGAKGRVAWALGLSPTELDHLIAALGLSREIDETRERFKREALAPRNLSLRLDLLGRTRYLADLGIKRRFTESLTAELREILKGSWGAAADLEGLLKHAAQRNGVAPELLARAVDRLELTAELRKHLRASH